MSGRFQEKLLFSRLKYKDKEAFIRVYDLYADKIYRFVYFKVGNSEEAQDLTSAAFLKAWNYVLENKIRDHNSLKSLLYTIARHAVIDHYRKSNFSEPLDRIENFNNKEGSGKREIADQKQNIARQMEISSDIETVRRKILELKDEYREVIILRFINELSIREIAEVLDKSKGNVRVLLHRALKSLKDLISEEEK